MLDDSNYRTIRERRSLQDLWREVGNQVTGSDIESGYSYVYTWLANQFGHFMIGFSGTILFGWLAIWLVPVSGVDYLSALAVGRDSGSRSVVCGLGS